MPGYRRSPTLSEGWSGSGVGAVVAGGSVEATEPFHVPGARVTGVVDVPGAVVAGRDDVPGAAAVGRVDDAGAGDAGGAVRPAPTSTAESVVTSEPEHPASSTAAATAAARSINGGRSGR